MKAAGANHRIEFFDPKTRPVALFWDADALLTAPESMMRSSGAAIYWRAVMNMGYVAATPLADLNRKQVFELVRNALPRLRDPRDAVPRIDLCIATFLQNREVDDGGGRVRHWVGRVVYAFAAALFNKHDEVGQGEANAALTPMVMRHLGSRDPEAMCRIAAALGVWSQGDAVAEAPARAAKELERVFAQLGMPTCLSQLGIPKDSLPVILDNAMMNFNSDPKREFVREKDYLGQVLLATW